VTIRDYIGYCYDELGYIPSYEEISENAADYDTAGDIHDVVTRFMSCHDLTGVEIHYKGDGRVLPSEWLSKAVTT
jgi:hypothetical protein